MAYQAGTILFAFAIIFLQLLMLAFAIVLFVLNRRRIREFFGLGLLLAIACFLLQLPANLIGLSLVDSGKLFERSGGLFSGSDMAGMLRAILIAVSVFTGLLGIGLGMMYYVVAAAEWEKLRPRPFPILMRTGERAWGRIGIAALAGAAVAVASYFVFRLLGVGENEVIKTMQKQVLIPDSGEPGLWQGFFSILFVSGAAASEEITFRGALLGWLWRASKNRVALIVLSIAAVSLLWAFLHVFNTDAPLAKMTQIIILGAILSALTRWWSLESAVAMHVSLNVCSVILVFLNIP